MSWDGKVEDELKKLKSTSKEQTEKWKLSKRTLEEEQQKKINLENARNQLEIEKRNGNWEKAGELSYQIIPNLENNISKIENTKNTLYGIGLGLGLQTKAGLLRLNFANGKTESQNFEFRNSKIHLSLTAIF